MTGRRALARRALARRALARLLAGALVAPLPAAFAAPPASAAPAGTTVVVAGDGDGDGGPALNARLETPTAAAYLPDGDLLLATWDSVRRVDAATGLVSTAVGPRTLGTGWPRDVAAGADGSVYVAEERRVRRIAPDGTTSFLTPGTPIAEPRTVAAAPGGAVYVAGPDPAGYPSLWRFGGGDPVLVAGGPAATNDTPGGPASGLRLRGAVDVEVTPGGDLLVLDTFYARLLRIAGGDPAGTVDVVAGTGQTCCSVRDGEDATAGSLHASDVAVAPDGTIYAASRWEGVRRFRAGGTVSTVDTGEVACRDHVTVSPAGALTSYCGGRWATLPGDGTVTPVAGGTRAGDGTPAAETWFADARDVTAGPDGTVYVLDGDELRSLSGGVLGTVATGLGAARRVTVAPDGTVYVTDGPGVRRVENGAGVPYAGVEGGAAPAAGADARTVSFGQINELAADAAGNLYLSVRAGCAVYRIDAARVVHVVDFPSCDGTGYRGLALLPDGRVVLTWRGNLYVADAAGVPRLAEEDWLDAVAVTPDGTIHGAVARRLPDGSRVAQEYPQPPGGPTHLAYRPARLAAEPAGTLLALDVDRVVRLSADGVPAPPTVTGLVVTPGPASLTLEWDDAATPEGEYVVRVAPGTVAPGPDDGIEAARVGYWVRSVVVRRAHTTEPPGLRAGEPYSVSVWAVSEAGRSVPVTATAVPLADTEAPPAPGIDVRFERSLAEIRVYRTGFDAPDHWRLHARLAEGSTPPASPAGGRAPDSTCCATGMWVVDRVTATYTVAVWAEDLSGNLSPVASQVVVADYTPPPAVTGLTLRVSGETLVATWDAPAPEVARLWVTSTSDGVVHEVPPATRTFSWPVPEWGVPYTVRVSAGDAAGNVRETEATLVPRIDLVVTLSRSARAVTYGQAVTLTGRLTDDTGQTFQHHPVQLWRRAAGATRFTYVTTGHTDDNGVVRFVRKPGANGEYQLRVEPAEQTSGATSAPAFVGVRARLAVALTDPVIALGQTSYVVGTIAPKHVGVPLTVQRYVPGVGWQRVVTVPTSSLSRVRVAVRPRGRGTYAYRVVFAGDADHQAHVSGVAKLTVT